MDSWEVLDLDKDEMITNKCKIQEIVEMVKKEKLANDVIVNYNDTLLSTWRPSSP